MSILEIEFKDNITRDVFMKWMEDSGHIGYQSDMEFSDNIPRKNMVDEFFYDYKTGKINTI